MSSENTTPLQFGDLALAPPVLKALNEVGYESPTPIQAKTIPHVLEGRDVIGQAQTGTGKTAAFALPLLSKIDLKLKTPQVLVLTPTRELAIQVAEAFQTYASRLRRFSVLPIYGGQSYAIQLKQLHRGVHVVVGTPGRVMDHMRRGTLDLNSVSCLVLDEADEMLRMGFIDDVEWILEKTPAERQITLFSATMPKAIRRIAERYLKDPAQVTIKMRQSTAETIHQRFCLVKGAHKLDALTRILESESFDGLLLFVRTKTATVELADKLEARGYAAAPLNGDIAQKQRERTVERLKRGELDILVATDVAARGLDVERISHVINYDIPYDTEAYVHRVGRTGRAGRTGEAILFVSPRERRLLLAIEKATKQRIKMMELPSIKAINEKRITRFKQQITDTLTSDDLGFYYRLMAEYQEEFDVPPLDIAAALAKIAQNDKSLILTGERAIPQARFNEGGHHRERSGPRVQRHSREPEPGMDRYRIDVGLSDGVRPGNIVGAIANEGGIESSSIGRIAIYEDYSTVDIAAGLPAKTVKALKKAWVAGKRLNLTPFAAPEFNEPFRKPGKRKQKRLEATAKKKKSRK